MSRNCYDFDKTIYNGDSTVDFYKYCLKTYPATALELPLTLGAGLLFVLKILPKTRFKQLFYRFLRHIPDGEQAVANFWELHFKNVKGWYLESKKDDLIISASPEFLLEPVCQRLNVELMASRVDIRTGKYTGENCWGPEKVRRLRERYPDLEIDEFYSDSYSDQPLADIARTAYLVSGDEIKPWNDKKHGGKQ